MDDALEGCAGASILLVSEGPKRRHPLIRTIESWGMVPITVSLVSAMRELDRYHDEVDVVVVDSLNNPESGLEIVPALVHAWADKDIILLVENLDQPSMIKVLRQGVFGAVSYSTNMAQLFLLICKAIESRQTKKALKTLTLTSEQLKFESKRYRERVDKMNAKQVETNNALKVLAENVLSQKEEVEKHLAWKLKSLLLPIVVTLKRDKYVLDKYKVELDLMIQEIEDFAVGLSGNARIALTLSPTEFRIASLIKNGLSSDEISERLNIAVTTVRTHRRNIRRKLKLDDPSCNLYSYLSSELSGKLPL